MGTEIYYFSGTGNSLAVARSLAGDLGATLLSIASMMGEANVKSDAETIGLVFPVYNKGLPLILTRFIPKLADLDGKYIFSVCTYGDTVGMVTMHLAKLIEAQGGQLAAGFGVHMPYNYLTPAPVLRGFFEAFTLREVPAEAQRELLAQAPQKIATISTFVAAGKSGTFEITSDGLTKLADRLNLNETLGKWAWLRIAGVTERTELSFLESRQLMDRGFHVDERCNGCGTCSRVCPVGNIEMVAAPGAAHKKPVWQQRCEQCFACLQWCPQEALQFRGGTSGKARYHHPEVKLADMLKQPAGD